MQTPIDLFDQDWQDVRKSNDANAHYCTLASVSSEGQATMRTLVLRHVDDGVFTVFINQSSPKWQELFSVKGAELHIFWPSRMMQYRIRGELVELDGERMRAHWECKPYESKLLDVYYSEFHKQSETVTSREELIRGIDELKKRYPDESTMIYPDHVKGLGLAANYIERWEGDKERRLHDRVLYQRDRDGNWQSQVLTP